MKSEQCAEDSLTRMHVAVCFCQNFYMVGRDKKKQHWQVLKIDRSEASELSILEDPTIYTEAEIRLLLARVAEGNRPTGGLKFVTPVYGIVGM